MASTLRRFRRLFLAVSQGRRFFCATRWEHPRNSVENGRTSTVGGDVKTNVISYEIHGLLVFLTDGGCTKVAKSPTERHCRATHLAGCVFFCVYVLDLAELMGLGGMG